MHHASPNLCRLNGVCAYRLLAGSAGWALREKSDPKLRHSFKECGVSSNDVGARHIARESRSIAYCHHCAVAALTFKVRPHLDEREKVNTCPRTATIDAGMCPSSFSHSYRRDSQLLPKRDTGFASQESSESYNKVCLPGTRRQPHLHPRTGSDSMIPPH